MKNRTFTLIELLVVVLIIVILAAIALPQYEKAVQKTRIMQYVIAARAISDAQKVYYLANGVYAEKNDELAVSYPLQGTTDYQVGDGVCNLRYSNDEAVPRVSCNIPVPYVVLQRRYKGDTIQCCSYYYDDYKGDGVCSLITGKTTWSNYCGKTEEEAPACHCYAE